MRHTINRRGIQRLQMEPKMHAAVTAYAEAVADTVRASAPANTGFFKASIEARHMAYRYARARVYSHDFKAYWIEYGAGPSPVRGNHPFRARHVFRDAVIACGLRWDDKYAGEG
jgi:hypothetical protein